MKVLEEPNRYNPYDREILFALATFNRNMGNFEDARRYAENLIELSPNNDSFQNLLDQLQNHDK